MRLSIARFKRVDKEFSAKAVARTSAGPRSGRTGKIPSGLTNSITLSSKASGLLIRLAARTAMAPTPIVMRANHPKSWISECGSPHPIEALQTGSAPIDDGIAQAKVFLKQQRKGDGRAGYFLNKIAAWWTCDFVSAGRQDGAAVAHNSRSSQCEKMSHYITAILNHPRQLSRFWKRCAMSGRSCKSSMLSVV